MIGLDTNVLVRLIVRDDPRQTRRADELLQRAAEDGELCLIADPVLCELEWVLESAYGATRRQIAATIQELLATPIIELENRELVSRALDAYREGSPDFSDCLVGAKCAEHGASTTYTFDRKLRTNRWFTQLR